MTTRYLLGPDARTTALVEALRDHGRVAVTGGPWTGKTTLVEGVNDRELVHTDAVKDEPWEAQPDLIIARMRASRALRRRGLPGAARAPQRA